MKKLFTIDDLMVGFIMAIGYGLGFAVPKAMGWPDWQCAVVCWVLGYVLQNMERYGQRELLDKYYPIYRQYN
jgi:hypothetical protein